VTEKKENGQAGKKFEKKTRKDKLVAGTPVEKGEPPPRGIAKEKAPAKPDKHLNTGKKYPNSHRGYQTPAHNKKKGKKKTQEGKPGSGGKKIHKTAVYQRRAFHAEPGMQKATIRDDDHTGWV